MKNILDPYEDDDDPMWDYEPDWDDWGTPYDDDYYDEDDSY